MTQKEVHSVRTGANQSSRSLTVNTLAVSQMDGSQSDDSEYSKRWFYCQVWPHLTYQSRLTLFSSFIALLTAQVTVWARLGTAVQFCYTLLQGRWDSLWDLIAGCICWLCPELNAITSSGYQKNWRHLSLIWRYFSICFCLIGCSEFSFLTTFVDEWILQHVWWDVLEIFIIVLSILKKFFVSSEWL